MYRTVFAFLATTLLWAQPCFAQPCQGVYGQRVFYNGQPVYANGQYGYSSYYIGPNGPAEFLTQQPQINQVQGRATFQGGISQTPWFANPTIRGQLNWNDQQFNTINNAYTQAWTTYNKGVNQLNPNLSAAQRQAELNRLQGSFYQTFANATNSAFTDPQQQQRFNQMNLQYRGYGAFSDPTVAQKLNLTDEQRQKLQQFGTDWTNQMNTLNQNFQTDRQGATKSFQQMQSQMNDRINSVLTPEQQRTWRGMIGDAYQFQPNVYFPSTGTTPRP